MTFGDIDNSNYVGEICIPDVVYHDGQQYIVTSIGYAAFAYCLYLESVILPYSVTTIDKEAFSGCEWLYNVLLPMSPR